MRESDRERSSAAGGVEEEADAGSRLSREPAPWGLGSQDPEIMT